MTETIKSLKGERLTSADVKTVGELHPSNRKGEPILNNFEKSFQKRIRKKCLGCCDNFTCSQSANYDYCRDCAINGSRYINKKSPCSECDGSGIIKFPNQPPRSCKTCYLTNQTIKGENIFTKNA